jgi:hypothetical protein
VSSVSFPTTFSTRCVDVLLVCRERYPQDRLNMSVLYLSRPARWQCADTMSLRMPITICGRPIGWSHPASPLAKRST